MTALALPGTVLLGAERDRVIQRHVRWLAGRLPSEAMDASRRSPVLALGDWLASRGPVATRRYRSKRG